MRQIELGWRGPAGRPRGTSEAAYPLHTGQRYLVPMDGAKRSHLLMPDTFHSWCGLTLAPEDGWLVDSGYDSFFWISYDDDASGKLWCKDCSRWQGKGMLNWPEATLPQDSPVAPDEWAAELGPELQARHRRLDMQASVVAGWFGGTAEVVNG